MSVEMHAYDLPLSVADEATDKVVKADGGAPLPEPMLLKYVLWLCQLRWSVLVILLLFGCLSFVPGFTEPLGLKPGALWPFAVAGILAAANLAFIRHAQVLDDAGLAARAQASLWRQVVFDLFVLTVVVHYVGSMETNIAFSYLFHIVLACIFLSKARSFAVTALASVLYVICVALEWSGVIIRTGIYADPTLREYVEGSAVTTWLNVGSSLLIWLVVWYLASRLSGLVRARDHELAATNRRLIAAQKERTQHMLRTTHELKAPFAAIDANTQLLIKGYCGVLPDEALQVLSRISSRSRRLSLEIREMLQLANLRSASDEMPPPVEIDLPHLLRSCMAQVEPLAEERGVVMDHSFDAARIVGVEDHLKMLFANIISNAVAYSDNGGDVYVQCAAEPGDGATVSVRDNGIGIAREKLPHIFDEYYRTDEAARHNKESTGLGLAIVRYIAQTHRIAVRVESSQNVGTQFTLRFPSSEKPPNENDTKKKQHHTGPLKRRDT